MKSLYTIAFLSLLAPSAFAQAAPAPEISWANNWEGALKEAQARNVPIHLAIHKDD